MSSDFADRYGPWAIVAGAGAGMGASYAVQLARRGLSPVLVDRDAAPIADLSDRLTAEHGVECRTLALDLADDRAVDLILEAADDLDVGLVVANAAASHVGAFRVQDPSSFEQQLRVNALAPTRLISGILPRFASRTRSGVIIMSSLSSRRGAPFVATYAATKAYLAILAESLWDELRDEGVDVLGVLPGPTRTPGWLSSMPQPGMGTASVMEPDDVVVEALDALGAGRPTLVPGVENRRSEQFLESMDPADAVRMVGQVMRETYPEERATDPQI